MGMNLVFGEGNPFEISENGNRTAFLCLSFYFYPSFPPSKFNHVIALIKGPFSAQISRSILATWRKSFIFLQQSDTGLIGSEKSSLEDSPTFQSLQYPASTLLETGCIQNQNKVAPNQKEVTWDYIHTTQNRRIEVKLIIIFDEPI